MKITCDIVKDLLPLYIDNTVSPSSKEYISKHIDCCPDCKDSWQKLQGEEEFFVMTSAEEIAPLQQIKQRLNRRKFITIGITIILMVFLISGIYYAVFVREHYVSYEDSDVHYRDGALVTNENYSCYVSLLSPDGKTIFIYLSNTIYEEHKDAQGLIQFETINAKPNDNPVESIYYLPEKYTEQYWGNGLFDENESISRKQVESMKEVSFLIWEK